MLANEKMAEFLLARKMWVPVLVGDGRLGMQKPARILSLMIIYTGKWQEEFFVLPHYKNSQWHCLSSKSLTEEI